jgi:phage-related protein
VTGAGTLRYISNVKTGQEIFLDLNVFSGETVTIDFARGKIESDTRGDLNYTLLSGSEIRSIYLLPGENTISVLMNDDVNASMQLRWEPLDWSSDSIVDAESL